MANIKSAQKRIKVTQAKNLRNRMVKSSVKTALKRFDTAVTEGNADTAKELFPKTVSIVDKAAQKGVIHKNLASRKKAQLSKSLASL